MKRFSAFGVPLLIALGSIGCSSKPTIEANSPASNNASVTTQTPQKTSTTETYSGPGQAPTKIVTPSSNPQSSPPPRPSGLTPTAQPRSVPSENPAAAPPKAGETVAQDFKIESGDRTVEVEGVCKLTEDEAICWKPNGTANDPLATELTNAIKSKTDSYSSTFQFRFQKKNRILVLKTVTAPPKPNSPGGAMSNGILNQMYGGSEFMEGWTNQSSVFSSSSSTSFDQSRTERQVLTGAFNRETKTFPLRYQFTQYSNTNRKTIPFKKGTFEIEGNVYEITSISDGAKDGIYRGPGMNANTKFTSISIKIIKVANPNVVVNLAAADENGNPYGGLDAKGNPVSQSEMAKIREEESKKMMEASRSGKPYQSTYMNNYINQLSLDPQYLNRSGMVNGQSINVEASKIKNLVAFVQFRTIFVFDKIHLDKN